MNLNLLKIRNDCLLDLEQEQAEKTDSMKILSEYKTLEPIRNNFLNYVLYTKQDYKVNWHHRYMCEKLQLFAEGKIINLMIFVPPQHGKSELATRRLPSYMLGHNPNVKITCAAYSGDVASAFNRDVQRIIDSPEYHRLFPNTTLARSRVVSASQRVWLRNSKIFEIVDFQGSFRSAGIGGALTSFKSDIAILDDVIKDALEAYSETYRDRVWDWYTNVLLTRLHNRSQKLLTITRWHEDDLAGRILHFEPDKWTVITLPGVKEDNLNKDDPRGIGEALWEDEHSLENLLQIKKLSMRTFVSLIQQRPNPEEGGIIKKDWFKRFNSDQLPKNLTHHFRSDTAYGKEKSDNSSTIDYSVYNDNLYIWDIWTANLSYPDFKRSYKSYIQAHNYTYKSECVFEPKATGISIVQDLEDEKIELPDPNDKEKTIKRGINIIEDESPVDSKETRISAIAPFIESGRVFLFEGAAWIEPFLLECAAFPNGKYDDSIDNLAGIIKRKFSNIADLVTFF